MAAVLRYGAVLPGGTATQQLEQAVLARRFRTGVPFLRPLPPRKAG
jgi:hypothetical protein